MQARKPYTFSFPVSNSQSRQSNAFERSVRRALKTLPLSTDFFHVSNITRRQCQILYPFQKPHCCFEKMLSEKVDIWANIHCKHVFHSIKNLWMFSNVINGRDFSEKTYHYKQKHIFKIRPLSLKIASNYVVNNL